MHDLQEEVLMNCREGGRIECQSKSLLYSCGDTEAIGSVEQEGLRREHTFQRKAVQSLVSGNERPGPGRGILQLSCVLFPQ